MRVHRRAIHFALPLAALLLAACSPSPEPAPQSSAAPVSAADAQAAKELDLYRDLLKQQSWELAAPIGKEIVARFPQSPAAKEVGQTLADTTARATALVTRRRLERLWSYQSGKESGGTQDTASIYSSDSGDRVRLVLRRHSEWGQSAYLFGSGKGFDCRGTCTLNVKFDDQPAQKLKAYLPPTGEAAIFISDDRGFIARLAKAQKIRIDVAEKGRQPRTLTFEVGGFDAARFPPLAKGK